MILSNYNAEYGNATGGVVNIVTKSGTNDFHGDVFGYLRDRSFQARNPFSFDVDPTTGDLDPIKQAYTRVQTGSPSAAPSGKTKLFISSLMNTRSAKKPDSPSIGEDNFEPRPGYSSHPSGALPVQLTSAQASAVNSLLTSGIPAYEHSACNMAF